MFNFLLNIFYTMSIDDPTNDFSGHSAAVDIGNNFNILPVIIMIIGAFSVLIAIKFILKQIKKKMKNEESEE